MPEEIEEVTGTEEVTDPIEEARAEDLASEAASAAVETPPVEEVPPVAVTPEGPTEVQQLQDQLIARSAELNKLQNQMRQALPLLKQMRDNQQTGGNKKVDPEEFLKAFVKDPEGVFKYTFGGYFLSPLVSHSFLLKIMGRALFGPSPDGFSPPSLVRVMQQSP